MTSLLRGFDATTELQLRILTPPDRSTDPDEYWAAFGRCILTDKHMYTLVTQNTKLSLGIRHRIRWPDSPAFQRVLSELPKDNPQLNEADLTGCLPGSILPTGHTAFSRGDTIERLMLNSDGSIKHWLLDESIVGASKTALRLPVSFWDIVLTGQLSLVRPCVKMSNTEAASPVFKLGISSRVTCRQLHSSVPWILAQLDHTVWTEQEEGTPISASSKWWSCSSWYTNTHVDFESAHMSPLPIMHKNRPSELCNRHT